MIVKLLFQNKWLEKERRKTQLEILGIFDNP